MPVIDRPDKKGSGEFRWPFWITVILILLGVSIIIAPNFIRLFAPNLIRSHPYRIPGACQSNCKNIGTALEMYSIDNHGYYPSALSYLTPDYLKVIPTCPSVTKDTYSPTYHSHNNAKSREYRFTFFCGGDNHSWYTAYFLGIFPVKKKYPRGTYKPDYPRYNSTDGLITF